MANLQVLLAIKRKLFRVAGKTDQELLPIRTEACSLDSGPQMITASISESFGKREFAGYVDAATSDEISGWLCRPKSPAKPCTVVLSLDSYSLISATTNIHRPDLDNRRGRRNHAGFQIDLTSDDIRERILLAVTELSGVGQPGSTEDFSKLATLMTWAIEDDVLETGDAVLKYYLPPPASFEATRTLADWLHYFDVAPEEVVANRNLIEDWPPLLPIVQASPGTPKVIAFYLPQFHPIAENDEWWGPGYTEWVGVATAEPNYPDHAAPNVPADLGFYDLRVRDVRKQQGELALNYGIYGFCYYFYWFSGRRILERPLDLMLTDGEPNVPFCLCWANEPWSRRWDGSEQEVLLEQKHDLDSDLKIIDDLLPYFEDPRYIRVDGKPVLLIYRPNLIEDTSAFTRKLRVEAIKRGLPGLHLCSAMTFGQGDLSSHGFDAAVEFPPHNVVVKEIDRSKVKVPDAFEGKIYDYADLVSRQLVADTNEFPHYPGVMPRWDNTARRPMKGNVYHGATPELFELWLRYAAQRALRNNSNVPFVFINSWNEWSEGAHLEPDRRYRRGFLESVRRVVAAEPNAKPANGGPSADSELARAVSSLMIENNLLAERVREMGLLTASPEMLPGLPTTATPLRSSCADGKCHIDYINGRAIRGAIVIRRRGPVIMRGWLLGSPKEGGRVEDFAYFVLTRESDGASYYSPVSDRESRVDVFEHFKIKTAHPFIGFTARMSIASLLPGVYAGRFIDVKNSGEYQVEVKDRFEII